MPIARHPYQKVVIDTAPLIDALTLELIEREPKWEPTILRESPLHPCIADDPTSQRNFRVLLNSIEEIIISSHVIGEIRSGRYLKPQELHTLYWQSCLNFFDMRNVNERLVTLRDLNNDDKLKQVVCVDGPTDAGLIALANLETTLYRPIGQDELDLIRSSGYSEFPPRLPHQPIFYPVLNEEYAMQIARDWNTKSGSRRGFVTRFQVRAEFLRRYEIKTVGSSIHQEYWIPAEDLPEFNRNIVGLIEVIAEYQG